MRFDLFRKVLWASLAATLLYPSISSAQERDKFVYGVPSVISSAVANFVFAKELGYFDEERIDLELVPAAGSGVTIPLLLSNQMQSTGASLEPLTISRAPGKQNFPLIFVYNYLRNSVWELAVLDSSPIKSVADLRGKTVGISAMSAGNVFLTRAILRGEGVAWSDISLQPVGFGAQAFEALKTKQIDVLNLWDSMHEALEQSGTKIRRLPMPKAFQGLSSHGFLVTQKLVNENPDLIARFGRAVTKGTVACEANPEGCLNAFFKHYPNQRPAGAGEEVMRRELAVMMSRLNNIASFAPGEEKAYGAYKDRDWNALISALKLGEQIPADASIPLDSLYTNKFVPEYNRFDAAHVVKQAKAYR